jgi:beta-phosphoglucomutase-like phosphatase (HAD superfamily)
VVGQEAQSKNPANPHLVTDTKITTIIFDMDGVLIDSEPAHKLAKERAFAKFGIVLPEAVYERYKGRPDETMMNEVARSIPGRKLDVDELLRIKHSEFEAIEQIAVPIEGAKALVNWAKSRFQVALQPLRPQEIGRLLFPCSVWQIRLISQWTHRDFLVPSQTRKFSSP